MRSEAGCAVDDLLEVHNLLWIRAKEPNWSGMGVDRWAAGDFDAMRTDQPRTLPRSESSKASCEGRRRLSVELRTRTGRDFRRRSLAVTRPGDHGRG